ncbi:hypothetical protein DVH24_026086 [Malus domestica]|uniref:Uncharacterized protein n=1 Tax=Malus domestica TaxID=3750 RepID=A0A498KF32_MALDO|nr:hypothetical protein DVH24_026086 [Malus domestica]
MFLVIIQLSEGENAKLKGFLILLSGMQYMPEKIRNKATFLIFLQNFLEEKSTSNGACNSDDMFPKTKNKNKKKSLLIGNHKKVGN